MSKTRNAGKKPANTEPPPVGPVEKSTMVGTVDPWIGTALCVAMLARKGSNTPYQSPGWVNVLT